MKRRSFPVWLLRDLPALIGVALSFWPLMIMVISTGRRAMSGKRISPRAFEIIMQMLPIAEARLHYALCRQAWRALGWNVRDVQLEILPPITRWSEVAARFEVYRTDMMDLGAAAARFTTSLRQLYRIRTSVDANAVHVAHGSTDALRAAHHEAVAAFTISNGRVALMVSSDQRERPSNHEGGLTYARGPPVFSNLRKQTHFCLSASTRLRLHRRARAYRGTPSMPDSLPARSDRSRISTRFWSTGPGSWNRPSLGLKPKRS
jgi:hypothetical protein